jgi:pimeloyl-ACP methyl ester carboxylesterase
MDLYCTGHGSPTIVLSSGLGDDFTIWRNVQPVLSRQTRVCSYDRAGIGWSEALPGVQDAQAIAGQLHGLINAAAIEKPFVLVGHSISGLYLREYAAQYGGDLAGMVFVDGSSPAQEARAPKDLAPMLVPSRFDILAQELLIDVGLARLLGYCGDSGSTPPIYKKWIDADSCAPAQVSAIEGELGAVRASEEETLHAGPFGNLPILILSRDPNVQPPNWPAQLARENSALWSQLQEESKDLSGQSKRVIAKGSNHYIQIDRPDVVNLEINAFVGMIRSHRGFQNNHSTAVE